MIRNLSGRTFAVLALLLGAMISPAEAAAPWTKIDVYPPDVNLSTSRDLQRVIAIATRGSLLEQLLQCRLKGRRGGLLQFEDAESAARVDVVHIELTDHGFDGREPFAIACHQQRALHVGAAEFGFDNGSIVPAPPTDRFGEL